MSLVQRQARPLNRDATTFRDDRLFIIACDDTFAPKQYFDFFQITRVQVHVVPTVDGTSAASHVLDRLLKFDHDADDELWMLPDTDHCIHDTHLSSFVSTISEAKRQGVNVALSKPCFELWLLLHHVEEGAVGSLSNAKAVETALRTKLGQYNKTNLKREHYPMASVSDAWSRAERLDAAVAGGEIPADNTTRIYQLWRAIVAKSLALQLPPELRNFVP